MEIPGQVIENVKEWEKTKSICTAGDTMEILARAIKEEDEED